MSNIFWKKFHLCFSSKLNYPQSLLQSPPSPPSKQDQDRSSSTSSLLIKSYNSLYHHHHNNHDFSSEFSTSKSMATTSADDHYFSSSSDSDSDAMDLSPPDFATIVASQRFFCSSPGRSNSIIESPNSTKVVEYPHRERTLDGAGVPVNKYSPDPYMDFRSSMQEMIDARNLKDVRNDSEFLHELLLCYLTLNPKHTHKFIISAFADILVSLLSSPESDNTTDWENSSCHRR